MSHSDIYYVGLIVGMLLLIGLLTSPVMAYDLSIDKNVTGGSFYTGDEVTWVVMVKNQGTDPVNLTVQEDVSDLKNVTWVANETSSGTFNETAVWNITGLAPGETAFLNITMSFTYPEDQTNRVNVTSVNGTEPVALLEAIKTVSIGRSLTATMEIKPETLNLKSKGVFTVFINVSGALNETEIDPENSTITCNEAELRKLIVGDDGDGKLIGKFERTGLNATANETAVITCVGEVVVGGETIRVEGSDTIRTIKEKPIDSILDKILKFLGLKSDEDEVTGEDTVDIPEDVKNLGQAKKYIGGTSISSSGSDDEEKADQEDEEQNITHSGKPVKEQNGGAPVTECNDGNCKGGKDKGA